VPLTVTNSNGCLATKRFYITASGIATINSTTINDFAGNENSVLIEYTGPGDEFSIDGSYFQDNPQFEGVAAGTYIAYARDKMVAVYQILLSSMYWIILDIYP
jgi:hypothetical protein